MNTRERIIEGCCQQLIAQGLVEPLSTDEDDTRAWTLYELASLIEGHFHVQLDLNGLSEMERLAYESRVSFDGRPLAGPHRGYHRPFWLLHEGRRVGTIAIATMIYGFDLTSISSLYVDPAFRKRNLGRRTLEAVLRATLDSGGGGIRLDTSWTWQPAVRFYARIGMWVRMWKHCLVFTWQTDLPPYRVEIGETEARFLIQQGDEWRTLVTARRLGDRLGWESEDFEGQPLAMSHCIPGTFALHLALAGWPLIRSEETWEKRYHWSDSGEPEGLAYKIQVFEAVNRDRGFDVRNPRIPGLEYPDLDDL